LRPPLCVMGLPKRDALQERSRLAAEFTQDWG
jgi:hypothetical protein